MMLRTCSHMELLPSVELRPSAEFQMNLGLQQHVAHVVPQFEKWYSMKYVSTS